MNGRNHSIFSKSRESLDQWLPPPLSPLVVEYLWLDFEKRSHNIL